MKEQHINCNIAKDLMMIYDDDLISADSRALVDEHLKECPECREYFDTVIKSRVTVKNNGKENIKKFTGTLQKIRKNGIVKGVAIALAAAIVLLTVYRILSDVPIADADASQLQVTCVYPFNYERENGEGIFMYLSFPAKFAYGQQSVTHEIKGDTLYLHWKKSVLSFHAGDDGNKTYDFIDSYNTSGKTINKIVCNGVTLWERSGDEVTPPEYVDYYNMYEYDYLDAQGRDVNGWLSIGNLMEAQFTDGTFIDWSLDGTEIKTGTIGEDD